MPYISKERRDAVTPEAKGALTAGELNYQFTRLLKDFVVLHGESYQTFNTVLGALEGAKLEFYRRVVVPHELQRMTENGDVY